MSMMCVAKLTDTTFVSGSGDRALKLWNVENNHAIRTFQGHTDLVQCVAKLTDTTFVSGSDDNTLKMWNVESNQPLRAYVGHTHWVSCVAKLTDNTFVSGSGVGAAATASIETVSKGVIDFTITAEGAGIYFNSNCCDFNSSCWRSECDSYCCFR